jgi:hypothetical protein
MIYLTSAFERFFNDPETAASTLVGSLHYKKINITKVYVKNSKTNVTKNRNPYHNNKWFMATK